MSSACPSGALSRPPARARRGRAEWEVLLGLCLEQWRRAGPKGRTLPLTPSLNRRPAAKTYTHPNPTTGQLTDDQFEVFRKLKPVFYEWAWGVNWAGEPRGCPGVGRPVFRSARFGQLELGVGRSLPPPACWGRIRGRVRYSCTPPALFQHRPNRTSGAGLIATAAPRTCPSRSDTDWRCVRAGDHR